MQLVPRLFKLWRWVDLDLFYVKVKFGHTGFCMRKSEKYLFFGNYCSLGSQSYLKHSAKWVNEIEWVSKVKVILWPWSKVTQISKLNVWLWPVYSGNRFRAIVLLFSLDLDPLKQIHWLSPLSPPFLPPPPPKKNNNNSKKKKFSFF